MPARPLPLAGITTARLRLRPLVRADVPALLVYRGDPRVCRYLPFPPMDEAVLEARLAADLGRREITAEGQALTWGVERISDGRLVGDVVLFWTSADHGGGEIGYVFDPAAAGRGYATEACAAVLDLAFDPVAGWGLHRVVARLDARNDASARLAERLGLRREAHHRSVARRDGEWSDLLVYAVLEEEWSGASDRGPTATA